MKQNLHPKYYPKARATCACGASFVVGSTSPEIHVDICSACHPYYTGKHKYVDTARRIDRFKEKMAKAEALRKNSRTKKKKK